MKQSAVAVAAGFGVFLLVAACGSTTSGAHHPPSSMSTAGTHSTARSGTAAPPTAPALFAADAVDKALLQPAQLGPDWGLFYPKDYPQGPASAFFWGCRADGEGIQTPVPAGGSSWQVMIATHDVQGQAADSSTLILEQMVSVYPTAEQADAAMRTLNASVSTCAKSGTVRRDQRPVPGDSTHAFPAGDDSWRLTADDEAGWSGWTNDMVETDDGLDEETSARLVLLRRGNVVLNLNINSTTPTVNPGFGKQARSLAARVLSALNSVAPAGLPAPSSSPSPPSGTFPRISADQLCAAVSPQQITGIAGFPVKKAKPATFAGGDKVQCVYDTYMVQTTAEFAVSPEELKEDNAAMSSKPISGVGDAAGWLQGGGVEARVGDYVVSVVFPTLTPNPYAPKGSTAPPLTVDAANKASLAILKTLLAAQY